MKIHDTVRIREIDIIISVAGGNGEESTMIMIK